MLGGRSGWRLEKDVRGVKVPVYRRTDDPQLTTVARWKSHDVFSEITMRIGVSGSSFEPKQSNT